jgi:hypothetical protein
MNTSSIAPQVPDHTEMRSLERSRQNGDLVIANVGLRKIGEQVAYWSATGEVYEARKNARGVTRRAQGRDIDSGGMIHDVILRLFPKLGPIVALHLSDINGVPMHAVANGRYWLEQGQPETAAKLWRCSVNDLPTVEDVEAFVDAQRDRWQGESNAAYALLQTL